MSNGDFQAPGGALRIGFFLDNKCQLHHSLYINPAYNEDAHKTADGVHYKKCSLQRNQAVWKNKPGKPLLLPSFPYPEFFVLCATHIK